MRTYTSMRRRLQAKWRRMTRDVSKLDEETRHEFEERVAICMFDGGLTEAEATEIAWRQIEGRR